MLTIHVWPKWLKAFLLAHDLYKSPISKQPLRKTQSCSPLKPFMQRLFMSCSFLDKFLCA